MTDALNGQPTPSVRTGQGSTRLTKEEFQRRWRERFYDPAFDRAPEALDELVAFAWDAYDQYRKSPRTRKAGSEFADPDFDLPLEWLETRSRIQQASARHDAVVDAHGFC